MNITSDLIENGKKATMVSILADIKDGDNDCLFFASESQIDALIDVGKLSSDYFTLWMDYQEEKQCMVNSAFHEFSVKSVV